MNGPGKVDVLLEWCSEEGFFIDGRLSVQVDEHGSIAVFNGESAIPAGQIVVTIPKDCVLSARSCALSAFIKPALAGPEAQLSLSVALYTELLLGRGSRWFGYLYSLPETIDLPVLWRPWVHNIGRPLDLGPENVADVEDALSWLKGTEAEKILRNADAQTGVHGDRLQAFFNSVVLPLVSDHMPGYGATLDGFLQAYCLVSSRAFLVDAFHGLAMVPIADAFNHIQENHVHLESDYSVCPECGSLDECPHDQEGDSNIELATPATPRHDCYEMVTNATVPSFSEVYNTYGETLPNPELFCQYGFLLEVNSNDALTWTADDILDAALMTPQALRATILQECSDCLKGADLDDTQSLISNHGPREGRSYIVNADGQTSVQLWVLLLTVAAQEVTADVKGMLPSLYELHTCLETQCGDSDSDDTTAGDVEVSVDALLRRMGDGCLGILRCAYQLMVGLCQTRRESTGKSGPGEQVDDLWDVLEALDTRHRRTSRAKVGLPEENEKILMACPGCIGVRKDRDRCEAHGVLVASSLCLSLPGGVWTRISPFSSPSLHLWHFMIKRMASKITAHIGGHHYQPPQHQSKTVGLPPPSPAASTHSYSDSSTRITPGVPIYEHRESISTQRTSASTGDAESQQVSVLRDPNAPAQARFPGRKTQRPKGTYRLTDFIIQRTLGTGSFGRVHLARSKHNLRFYAIKVLNKERIVKLKQVEHTNNEMLMLESVQHPFIINLWGSFQDSGNLYMVMDFVPGGELFTLLRRSNRFPDPVAKFYSAEVALALNYLHSLDIVYRDLKPENILLNTDGHVKIADFGFAKSCETTTWTLCGTPDYLAPEIVSQQRYNKSVDWYALGVLIYEMLSGLPPYHQQVPNHLELYEKIMQGPRYIRWPTAFHENATDLILKLMESDPSRRYGNLRHGAGDVFAHPWFREVDWDKLANREIMAPYLPRITGDGDASAFDNYPEDNVAASYGLPAPDMFGTAFPAFEYTSPMIMSS